MDQMTCDLLIIGAGTAGLQAYKTAEAKGADVLIVERGGGGSTCTRVGCMPSKLLIAAGRTAEHMRRAGLFGVRTGEVAIDGLAVMARVRAERDRFDRSVVDEFRAIPAERRIQGEARFVGPTTVMVGDDLRIETRAVVVAAGAHPAVPKALQALGDRVLTNRTVFEMKDLPRSLAVVGAGPQGLELAQAFARLGVRVTMFDDGDVVGKLKDPEAAAAARQAFVGAFDLYLGVEVEAEPRGDGAVLRWPGGSVEVDRVLAATGQPPNLDQLALDQAGLSLDDGGVPEFDHASRRCGNSAVFPAGDVGGWRPVLHEAARGGRVAAAVALGEDAPAQIPAFAIAFCEPNLVEVGVRFDALPESALIGTSTVRNNGRSRIDGEEHGLARLYAERDGTLLGGTIVATGGEHLGHALALAVDQGMTAAAFADQPWYHPTVEEMLLDAARDVDRQVKKG